MTTENIETDVSAEADAPPMNAKEELKDFFKTAMIAVALAIIVRSLLFEPFNIPSGSMKPTLEVGDYLFVYKPAYGYSRYSFPYGLAPIAGRIWADQPERGDIVVFKLPTNPSVDFIKRIIGMPGDTIQMVDGRLYINNELIPRKLLGTKQVPEPHRGLVTMNEYEQTLPGGATFHIYEESDFQPLDNTQVFHVPEGHYFMMGDSRDNSQDSRVKKMVGMVPFDHIVGRAQFLFFSINEKASLFAPWNWPFSIRYGRLFTSLAPDRS